MGLFFFTGQTQSGQSNGSVLLATGEKSGQTGSDRDQPNEKEQAQ